MSTSRCDTGLSPEKRTSFNNKLGLERYGFTRKVYEMTFCEKKMILRSNRPIQI